MQMCSVKSYCSLKRGGKYESSLFCPLLCISDSCQCYLLWTGPVPPKASHPRTPWCGEGNHYYISLLLKILICLLLYIVLRQLVYRVADTRSLCPRGKHLHSCPVRLLWPGMQFNRGVPKPGPNAVWSFETCLNLHFPSSQVVLKSQLSFELHPRVSTTSASTTPTLAPTEHLTRSVAGLSPLILLIPLGSLRCTFLDLQRPSLTGCWTLTMTTLPVATNAKMRLWNLPTFAQESATLR